MNNIIEKFMNEYRAYQEWYKENRVQNALFDYHNCKLYEAFSIIKNNFEQKVFKEMCEDEYNNFQDILKENDVTLNYIGRTSSFMFRRPNAFLNEIDECNPDTEIIYSYIMVNSDNEDITYEEVDKFLFKICNLMLNKEENIKFSDIDYNIINEISFENIKNEIQPIIECRNYLENFKENQVNLFSEYIFNTYDNIKYTNDMYYDDKTVKVFEIIIENNPLNRRLMLFNKNKIKTKEIKADVYEAIKSSKNIDEIYKKLKMKEKYDIYYSKFAESFYDYNSITLHTDDIGNKHIAEL